MVNIYDNANQLAKDLQETEQFKDLKKSLEKLKNNPESLDLYQRMDKLCLLYTSPSPRDRG